MNNKTLKTITKILILAGVLALIWWIYIAPSGTGSSASSTPAASLSALTESYTDAKYHFSVSYPAGLKASEFPSPDGTGDVLLIADSQTGTGMQAYITPFDEPAENLTADRVRTSLPDLTIADPQPIQVGGSGKGISFRSGSGADEKAQEWFVAGGNLYQVTAPASFAETLKTMISTWKFQ